MQFHAIHFFMQWAIFFYCLFHSKYPGDFQCKIWNSSILTLVDSQIWKIFISYLDKTLKSELKLSIHRVSKLYLNISQPISDLNFRS